MAVPQHHPEKYRIKIQKEVKGEMMSIWVTVTEEEYNEIKLNDYYKK